MAQPDIKEIQLRSKVGIDGISTFSAENRYRFLAESSGIAAQSAAQRISWADPRGWLITHRRPAAPPVKPGVVESFYRAMAYPMRWYRR